MPEERYQHRPINRGCGGHYGYKDDCQDCQDTKAADDAVYKAFKEAEEKKKGNNPPKGSTN